MDLHPHLWHDLSMMLGRLMERTEASDERLIRIENRLMEGHTMFARLDGRLKHVEAATVRLETSSSDRARVPRWERTAKRWLAWLLPAATLYSTGSLEAAIKALDAVK